ncbi:ubiquitinyl hydrolase 1 [Malassezia sp. CBS 17886]|nr:ubiquitinyl hydrolase 1 [Malassezia sp. CBS 17886]
MALNAGLLSPVPLPGAPRILSYNVDQGPLKTFLGAMQRNSDLFDSTMHQDAHEFLNFLLNQVGDDATETTAGNATPNGMALRRDADTPISYRDEAFLDLSINVSQNTSLSSCLREFSEREMLSGRDKFFCGSCSSLQEAEKRMKVGRPPNVLALHLKRFIWDESAHAYIKHVCRVVFPHHLRLFNTSDQALDPDQAYELFAIIIHIGANSNQGHYVSIVKIGSRWALFDDDTAGFIPESDISKYYGDAPETGSAYVLFYQAVGNDELMTQDFVPAAQAAPVGVPAYGATKSVDVPATAFVAQHTGAPPTSGVASSPLSSATGALSVGAHFPGHPVPVQELPPRMAPDPVPAWHRNGDPLSAAPAPASGAASSASSSPRASVGAATSPPLTMKQFGGLSSARRGKDDATPKRSWFSRTLRADKGRGD